jgi:hypothetical protein
MIAFQTWIVWQLRKISYRWYARYQCLKAAKVQGKPNTYVCNLCKNEYKKEGKKRTITIDHIIPCKDPSKPQAFQEALDTCQCGVCDYLRKMFCGPDGLQVLCKDCHDKKTGKEMTKRKKARKIKKAAKNVSK